MIWDGFKSKILHKAKPVIKHLEKTNQDNISEAIKRRENTILAILLSESSDVHIEVEYAGTKAMFFSKMISIIGVIILIIDIVYEKKGKNKKSSIA